VLAMLLLSWLRPDYRSISAFVTTSQTSSHQPSSWSPLAIIPPRYYDSRLYDSEAGGSGRYSTHNVNGSNRTDNAAMSSLDVHNGVSGSDSAAAACNHTSVGDAREVVASGAPDDVMYNGAIFTNKQNGQSSSSSSEHQHWTVAPEVNQWTAVMSQEFLQDDDDDDTLVSVEALYQELKDMSDNDKQQVEKYWDRLMPTVSYLGTYQVAKIYDALRVAYRAHRGQLRKSGEPFIVHPVEVALLLSELKMDAETVMAGLLHDTVEDTELTFTQIEAMFGQVVRSIVEGETKVSKLPKLAFDEDYADEQAENLRQMFVAMTDDYRISKSAKKNTKRYIIVVTNRTSFPFVCHFCSHCETGGSIAQHENIAPYEARKANQDFTRDARHLCASGTSDGDLAVQE
jgi:hypothetical protein